MPKAKTECTELSVGFGLLQCDPINISSDNALKLWDGTLDNITFLKFIKEFQQKENYYRKFYNIGVNLVRSHKILARSKINVVKWEGPRQQAKTVSVPIDILAANVPISVKADSNIVENTSPDRLFISLPNGLYRGTKTKNWYLQTGGESYQNLYLFVHNADVCCTEFPLDVADYHKQIKGDRRRLLSEIINNFSSDKQEEFNRLYVEFCHIVAKQSSKKFNQSLGSLDLSMRNSVFESIMRLFFRLGDTEYVLCGLDKGKGFSVVIPDLSSWKRNWKLKQVIALPDLTRRQAVVNFILTIQNKVDKTEREIKFHTEIRWSHRKFKGNPESKLYKEFNWMDLPFLERIENSQIQKIELIGTGGFGNVYRSKIAESGKIVALKEFSAQGSESDRLRFEREVKIQQRLNHPNILQILLTDLSDPIPWFVVPLARCNLADLISELSIDEKRIFHIFRQILIGLQYAHGENVIHRDIKPENILIFENDHVEIGDFGLGKRLNTDILTQSSENAFGTLHYAAPEQLESFRDADHRSDIYALGKTLFHIVTGVYPPPFYSEFPLDIADEKYREFIGKCTEKEPVNRFQNIQQALALFDNIK